MESQSDSQNLYERMKAAIADAVKIRAKTIAIREEHQEIRKRILALHGRYNADDRRTAAARG
jgi:hypothetical protein